MDECHKSIFAWGDPSLAWIATHLRHDWLTPVMIFFTEFGQVGAILFTLGFSYWLWNKQYARMLIYGLFLNIFINLWLKNIVKECRPPSYLWLDNAHDYSFPSGHSQVGIYLWVGLAIYVKEKWLSVLYILIGLLIVLSRPYLGVHYIQDVVAGAILGLTILWLTIWLGKNHFDPLAKWPFSLKTLTMIGLLLLYQRLLNDPSGSQIAAIGACFGFWLGAQLEMKLLHFEPPRRVKPILIQIVLGSVGLMLFWKGGDILRHQLDTNISSAIKYLQYTLIGLWISFLAPLLFKVRKPKHA